MNKHMMNTPRSYTNACPALVVSQVEKIYGGADTSTRALAGVSFTVQSGEMVAIMGPSGSGKSTLLNCISTIDMPTAGTVAIGGQETATLSQKKLAAFRRESLGFVFQDSNLLDTLTARENIALPLSIGRVPAAQIQDSVTRVSTILGVTDVLDKYPHQMSGGQRQRVAAARAIVTNPTLILADEHTGALDSKNARILLECFEKLNTTQQATVLMVTHDEYAASWCQRVIFIRDGKLFAELVRGDKPRREFFDRIIEVVATIGGDVDAR